MNYSVFAAFLLVAATGTAVAQSKAAPAADGCGEVVTIATHGGSTTRYALAQAQDARIALVLLVGGGGNVSLDDKGCPRGLKGNSLVRSLPYFHDAGFVTALVDAPSDHPGEDGLAAFRIAPQHAEDLGKVIVDVRTRTNASVWLVGHSRGTISAANAAARLSGPSAPDGVVLMSAMMVGEARAKKALATQSVFDLPLEAIKIPVLVVGHAADSCPRSPAGLMDKIAARTQSARRQVVIVTGGSIAPGRAPSLSSCEVNEPHDYVGQETEVAAGIVRFIRGGNY
jgi:pimeloyl-ACP methyl ester carboxylesterase